MASVRVRRVSYHPVPIRTRMPFRYGIAELRETTHLFVRAEVEVEGKVVVGVSADNLPPKWFTKDPESSFEDDLKDMVAVIRAAGRHAIEAGEQESVASLVGETYARQKAWAGGTRHPPLLWNFGVSLVERAVIDATCRSVGLPFHRVLRDGVLGIPAERLGFMRAVPVASIRVRHTVGLSDPLTEEDVPPGQRLADGLPQTLVEAIRTYGLKSFKIKLSGNVDVDRVRLSRLAQLLHDECPDFTCTLDGNENFRDVRSLYELWAALHGDPAVYLFLTRLIFLEQPLHRDVALETDLRAWRDRPPVIIDESDADETSLARALELGYVGTSHKNCKGVFKGLRNAELLARRRAETGETLVLSGEDLTNVGPVALLQDLAVLAALGIEHAERNGQHYVRGLTPFPPAVQDTVLAHHPDLYRRHAVGFGTLRIDGGAISTQTVSQAPFGYAMDFDPADHFPAIAE